jgi:hypothetical protein
MGETGEASGMIAIARYPAESLVESRLIGVAERDGEKGRYSRDLL